MFDLQDIGINQSICSRGGQAVAHLAQAIQKILEKISQGEGSLMRFRLTSPLAPGGNAAANILAFEGGGYSIQRNGIVFDEEPGGGFWQGDAGDEGWCTARDGAEGQYSVLFMTPVDIDGNVNQSYLDLITNQDVVDVLNESLSGITPQHALFTSASGFVIAYPASGGTTTHDVVFSLLDTSGDDDSDRWELDGTNTIITEVETGRPYTIECQYQIEGFLSVDTVIYVTVTLESNTGSGFQTYSGARAAHWEVIPDGSVTGDIGAGFSGSFRVLVMRGVQVVGREFRLRLTLFTESPNPFGSASAIGYVYLTFLEY